MNLRRLSLLVLALVALPLAGCGEKVEENPNVVKSDPNSNLMAKPHAMPGAGGAASAAPAKPTTE